MPRLYDVSLPISEGMVTWPSDPSVRFRPHSRIEEGDKANVTELALGSHTGTHVDAPWHFLEDGRKVDELPLDLLIGPAVVVELPDEVTAVGERELRAAGIEGAARLLLKTRNGALLEREGFQRDFTHLTGAGADYLVASGVRLVGIDYLSVEAYGAEKPEAHLTLLGREVVIVEGLDLREVPAGRYELFCLPLRLAGIDGAPVRAVLREAD